MDDRLLTVIEWAVPLIAVIVMVWIGTSPKETRMFETGDQVEIHELDESAMTRYIFDGPLRCEAGPATFIDWATMPNEKGHDINCALVCLPSGFIKEVPVDFVRFKSISP